jgi:hypothetical protein
MLLGPGPAPAQVLPQVSTEAQTWQSAQALIKAGRDREALPLVERLVSAHPRHKGYRFELAVLLSRLGLDGRARHHLEQVRGAGLNPAETQMVDRVVAQIDARKVWSGYFNLSIRPESNGARQTQDQVVVIGGIPFTLSDTAIGKPTVSTIVTTGLAYSPTIGAGLKAQFSLSAYLRYNEEVALRDYHLTGRAGLSFSPDARRNWSGGVLLGTRRAADRPYSETFGFYAGHARRVGKAGTFSVNTEVSRAFRRGNAPDTDRQVISLSYSHAIGGNALLTFSGYLDHSDTAQRTLAGVRKGVSISGLYAFEGGLVAGLTLRGDMDDRDGIEPLFGRSRNDHKLSLEARLYHREFTLGSFAPEVQFGIERNRSNIPLADYTNRYISLGLTRKF